MGPKDRTAQFVMAASQIRSRMGDGVRVAIGGRKPNSQVPGIYSLFTNATRQTGRDIKNTVIKLEELATLVDREYLFNDPRFEIEGLTYIIRGNIASLERQISQLENFARALSSSAAKQMRAHANMIVAALKEKLTSISEEFKQVLETRTGNLKRLQSQRQGLSAGAQSSSEYPWSSLLMADDEPAQARNLDAAIDMDGEALGLNLSISIADLDHAADQMQRGRNFIKGISDMYRAISQKAIERGRALARMNSNVRVTSMSAEAVHIELLKYYQSTSSNQWLTITVFVGLLVIALVSVVFIY